MSKDSDEFDPMALLAGAEPLSPPSSWESLAQHSRALAAMAEQMAKIPPRDLAPRWQETGDPDDDVPIWADPLRDLTERGQVTQRLTAACRRDVWARLHDEGNGMSHKEIAKLWGVKRAAVGNALSRGPKESDDDQPSRGMRDK